MIASMHAFSESNTRAGPVMTGLFNTASYAGFTFLSALAGLVAGKAGFLAAFILMAGMAAAVAVPIGRCRCAEAPTGRLTCPRRACHSFRRSAPMIHTSPGEQSPGFSR